MNDKDLLAQRFEADRDRLRAVAYRMLGSVSEAEDAVQEAWFKLSRSDASAVENLGGWLTTVVGRVCLDMLRSRTSRREDSLDARVHLPDPVVQAPDQGARTAADPEQQALIADSVGLALLVVLETLGPAERLAFVLHDMFGVSFDEIGPIVGRTPTAARQLASRARRRVRGAAPEPERDAARQRKAVDAFLAAARGGDFEGLLAVLDPDVLLRADGGSLRAVATTLVRGARAVASQALMFSRAEAQGVPVLVNGNAGLLAIEAGSPSALLAFTVSEEGLIVEIDILVDPERLERLDVGALDTGTDKDTGTDTATPED
ncbi:MULTISPECIES: sigma-70 family RNA polymerase sigma factor [Streptomyces]|uniref:Sigma-70 family RNA polymerase sigma factor n=1 Tax=Streptomyces solicathayae TaxID=3081768 RepID=A0ABZ0LVE0_9ACTN|nr:sigma-70 family RNA polymerase sigma factor [Streptomyces sp. HUAS YS2]WOX23470.1 sigma-70 family RNA polymerase sigma factor [Streptomyces sp. HUAS YS2]